MQTSCIQIVSSVIKYRKLKHFVANKLSDINSNDKKPGNCNSKLWQRTSTTIVDEFLDMAKCLLSNEAIN